MAGSVSGNVSFRTLKREERQTDRPHWLQLLCGTKGATAPDAAWGASPDLG